MTDAALDIAVDFIAEEEGFRSEPYMDVAGVPTIGYGFTYHLDGSRVAMTDSPISESEARDRLREIVHKVLNNVRVLSNGVDLTPEQEAALTSFAYNLGAGALRTSSLLAMLKQGDISGAADQFPRWVYAGGKVWPGLVKRRAREAALFLQGQDTASG